MDFQDILKIVVSVIVSSGATAGLVYVKAVKGKVKALQDGMLSLLRAEIIRSHDKYSEKEFCPIYAKDAIDKAYNAYHTLGGNGTITVLYKEIMALPEEIHNREDWYYESIKGNYC